MDWATLWHGEELNEKDFPVFSAWKKKQAEIDGFFRQIMRNRGASALALTSEPATGKSTTLVRHIVELAAAAQAPSRVLYVVPTAIEAAFISSWFYNHGILHIGGGTGGVDGVGSIGGLRKVQVMTTEIMNQLFSRGSTPWMEDITVILDINWYPTVDDEIALARILDRMKKVRRSPNLANVRMAVVLLMSAYEEERVVGAFERTLGSISKIVIQEYPEGIGFVRFDVENAEGRHWTEDVRGSIKDWDGQGRALYVGESMEVGRWKGTREYDGQHILLVPGPRHVDVIADQLLDEDLRSLTDSGPLIIEPETPFALGLKNVSLVVTGGSVGVVALLDAGRMQLVRRRRAMSRPETDRIMSWAFKSSRFGISDCPQPIFAIPKDFTTGVTDHFGPAHNQDLPFLILENIRIWPGTSYSRFPSPSAPDYYTVVNGFRRLLLLGCTTRCPPNYVITEIDEVRGGYRCTELGELVLAMWRVTNTSASFQVAYLLARIKLMRRQDPAGSLRVARVLVHMAAITYVEIAEFVELKQGG